MGYYIRCWPHVTWHSQAYLERALGLLPASTRSIKCECSVAIVLAVLVVMRALTSPATTLAVVSTYINDVKIIASLTFMRFQVLFYVTSTLALLVVVSSVIS